MDRQIIATWATATAAMWAVGAADAWTQAMAHWAIFPMLQLVFGFAVTVNGILVSSPVPVVGGLLLIFTAPLFLAFPVWSSVASGIACAAVILVTTLGLALHLRQVRAAS